MTATQLPFLARLGLHVGAIGSLASLAVGVGTAVDAAARIGLYAVTTGGSEQLGIGVGGIQGPTFTRNGSAVDTTLPGDVVISGNLTVSGTTTTINSTVVNVQDKVLSVAYTAGANVAVPAVIAGITVYRGAIASVARDSAGLFWDETNSTWKFALNTGNDNSTLGAAQAVVTGALTASSVTNSGLTTGRIAIISTAGLMADSASLLYSASTQIMVIGDGAAQPSMRLNGSAAGVRDVIWQTAGNARWVMRCNATAEAGADAGSDFNLVARHDDGTLIDTVIAIARVSGGAITIARPILVQADTDTDNTIGRVRLGLASSGTADRAYFAHYDQFSSTNYALSHSSSGGTAVNAATGQAIGLRINNTEYVNLSSTTLTVSTVATSITGGLTANTITNSALTSGRVVTVTTSGLLNDSSAFTWDGSAVLTLGAAAGTLNVGGSGATAPRVNLKAAAGNIRGIQFMTASTNRWQVYANSDAEGGSDAGSTFNLAAYTDAGSFIDNVISIARVSTGVITLSRSVTMADAKNFAFNTSTGTKFGTATSQKIGFWNATPIVQPVGATQAAPAAYVTGAFGLDSTANMQALYDLVVAMRTALVNTGLIKGAA